MAAKIRSTAACLEHDGLLELEMALVGTPASQLVGFMAARVHGANMLAAPSSRAPFPSVEMMGSHSLTAGPEESPLLSHHHHVGGPEGV